MPLIVKAAGNRIYFRGSQGQAQTHIYPVQDWLHIKDRAETPNFFAFEFPQPCLSNGTRYIPAERDEILVYKSEADYTDDVRWFGGVLTKIQDRMIQLSGEGAYLAGYKFEASSFEIILDKELRQPEKSNLTWGDLLTLLMQRHFSTQLSADYSLIVNPVSAPPIRINNGSMKALLSHMRRLTGYDYRVDNYKRLNVFQALSKPAGFALEDSPAGAMTVYSSRPEVTREARAIYNIIRQPFLNHIGVNDWDGETFTAKGDPVGQGGGQFPLVRTPSSIEETISLVDKFDSGPAPSSENWIETDVGTTQHVDYPNQGYMFVANGQLQLVGGTGSVGGVALSSKEFFQAREGSYIVQEFQLTNTTGEGYIGLFTDGAGLALGNIKAGLKVLDNQLRALDGTVLVATLGTTTNYILWTTQTATGWQYDIYGGAFATKQKIREETGVTHLTDYKAAAVINKSMQASINSFQYRNSDRSLILEINGVKKVVGLEQSDTDLPDIDAFLNTDETPALLKFRGAEDVTLIAAVGGSTSITLTTGHGPKVRPGHRLLVGDNLIEAFSGREAWVESVAGDVVTLRSPGLASPNASIGQQILIGSTVPAKNDKLLVRYSYTRQDEAAAIDQASVSTFGPYPITLDQKEHLRRFEEAQGEAEAHLSRFKHGILSIVFNSNSSLIPEPDSITTVPVDLQKRPDPIDQTLTLQRVEITAAGKAGYKYSLQLESADPVKPINDLLTAGRKLVIGQEGDLRFFAALEDEAVADDTDLVIEAADSPYITWGNLGHRHYGHFKWKPSESGPIADFSDEDNVQVAPALGVV